MKYRPLYWHKDDASQFDQRFSKGQRRVSPASNWQKDGHVRSSTRSEKSRRRCRKGRKRGAATHSAIVRLRAGIYNV